MFSGISAAAQQADCPKPNDKAIVKAIYKKMLYGYKSQIRHVNIRSKDGVVTLEGWTTTEKVKDAIEKIAADIKCVKSVDNQLNIGIQSGCGPGQKKCGSICIPIEETCNICTTRTCN
jgi:osmotically-inducible protein OsmY